MKNIHRFIEHTNLKPTLIGKDIDRLVAEAKAHAFLGVCVPPFWVKRASGEIGNDDTQLITVVGFPLGYQMTESKEEETRLAIRDGADEIDVVMNISAFKEGMMWFKIELVKLSKMIHEAEKIMKVILETAYLDDNEILKAASIAKDAGVDFVKTSTGFAHKGAQLDHIRLLRKNLPSQVGIKASGGIKTRDDALAFIEAGADRIGSSSGIEIVKALQ